MCMHHLFVPSCSALATEHLTQIELWCAHNEFWLQFTYKYILKYYFGCNFPSPCNLCSLWWSEHLGHGKGRRLSWTYSNTLAVWNRRLSVTYHFVLNWSQSTHTCSSWNGRRCTWGLEETHKGTYSGTSLLWTPMEPKYLSWLVKCLYFRWRIAYIKLGLSHSGVLISGCPLKREGVRYKRSCEGEYKVEGRRKGGYGGHSKLFN